MQNTIRIANAQDFFAIMGIDQRVIGNELDRTDQILQAIGESNCHVLFIDSRIVGFEIATPESFRGMDFLDLLVVDHAYRSQGIATALVSYFIKNSSTSECWTSTNESNVGMISLLKKLGWTESGHKEDLDPGDPDLFFSIRCVR